MERERKNRVFMAVFVLFMSGFFSVYFGCIANLLSKLPLKYILHIIPLILSCESEGVKYNNSCPKKRERFLEYFIKQICTLGDNMTRAKSKQLKDKQRHVTYCQNSDLDTLIKIAPEYRLRRYIQTFNYSDRLSSIYIQTMGHCVLCGFNNVDALEVHHIDHNHNNNTWKNVTVVCANCHNLIHKRKLNYWEELNRKNSKI